MTLRIKTTRIDFDAAADGGYVYGQIIRRVRLPVYVELGIEQEYIPSPQDNPMTEYKFFRDCNVYVAKTEEQLDAEDYILEHLGVAVVIYC